MSVQDEKDCNLMIVASVEEYAQRHNISTEKAIELFRKYDVFSAIRSQYSVLHMVDFDEITSFAEDILKWKTA